ncbi:MAG TPA: hypothetical protein VJ810_08270 [Blastocatellia bacterium]|nr:hypothetical protein [Blastocatellia bacterium]
MEIIVSAFLSLVIGIESQLPAEKASFHLPLTRSQSPTFPLKLIADGSDHIDGFVSEIQIGVGKAKLSISLEEGASFSGRGNDGKAWEITIKDSPLGLGYHLYSGDLDKNGLADLVFITYTAANGFLPFCILSIITFDSQGLPVLLRDGQDVEAKQEGIAEIVDLDGDGKAELIATHYDNDDGKDKWDGYYIADIYEVEEGQWRRLNRYGNYSFPVYTPYSSEDKGEHLIRKPEKPAPGRRPSAPDYSTILPVASGKIMDVSRQKNGFVSFKIGASKGGVVTTFREVWDKCYLDDFVLTIDTKEKRQIRVLAGSEETIDLDVQTVKFRNAKFYGNCVPGRLSPNLVWITK